MVPAACFRARHRYIRFRVPSGVLMTASLITPHQEARHPLRPLAQVRPPALPPLPPQQVTAARPEGLLQVHTAAFRGSFSGVFSQALRTAGLGSRVLISQFLKGGVDQGPERSLWLCGRLQWMRPALSSCLIHPAADPLTDPADRRAVEAAWTFSREQLLAGAVDLVVLDELGLAIALGYLPADDVVSTLEQQPAQLDVILTGPSMPADLIAMADQVTQLCRGA